MKSGYFAAALLLLAPCAFALDGQITIHDPSTVTESNGKYYTYGTGGNPLVSDDGWTWRRGVTPLRTGAAPDVIHIGDRYFMYISGVTMIWNKTLDPDSPDFKWEEGGSIAGYESKEDFVNPIDPGAFLDPKTGRLWMTYGSYVGFTRVVELDPKTGKRLHPDQPPTDIGVNLEATTMISHDGYYYLLGTRGSCCRGADSGYNIRVGRSKNVTGPFVDNMGIDMIKGGGKLVIGSGGRLIGPGHFGLINVADGVQKFSFHWEADMDRGNASVLDIRPLLWKDGWPVAGENMKDGTYEVESVRNGSALELAVQGVPVGGAQGGGRGGGRGAPGPAGDPNAPAQARAGGPGGRGGAAGPGGPPAGGPGGPAPAAAPGGRQGGGPGGGGGGGLFAGTGGVIPQQDVAEVSKNWPTGDIAARLGNYMVQAQQKWTVSPAPNAGGYLGSPYFKITVAGTDRALAATPDAELVTLPAFTGGPEQLWRIDQLTDGSYRIVPKSQANAREPLALSAIGTRSVTLTKFDASSDKHRWQFKTP
jgi:arabinan endo-1,5-alpha-L-arabinosidase